jgi:hypothetical protein
MKRFTCFIIVILTTAFCYAGQPEKFYQNQWCTENRGKSEVVLPDQTRCDCLTDTNAIEFDFGKKWAEAIGQSLYYSAQTGKKAGIVLILKNEKEYKYWIRLNSTITHFNLPIDTWYMMDQSR